MCGQRKTYTHILLFMSLQWAFHYSRTLIKGQDPLTGVPHPLMRSSSARLPLLRAMPLPLLPTCPRSPPLKRPGSKCTPCWMTPLPLCRPPLRAVRQALLSQGSTVTTLAQALQNAVPDTGVLRTNHLDLFLL